MKETKQARFKRLAEARVNKIVAMLRLLGNCSNKSNYEYTEEQVGKILNKLHFELDKMYDRFVSAMQDKGRFSLSEEKYSSVSDSPTIFLELPDGSRLKAVAAADDMMPNLSIYLQPSDGSEQKSVCYAEYNYEREVGKELCIGIWDSQSEDPYMYVPFNKGDQDD